MLERSWVDRKTVKSGTHQCTFGAGPARVWRDHGVLHPMDMRNRDRETTPLCRVYSAVTSVRASMKQIPPDQTRTDLELGMVERHWPFLHNWLSKG